MLGFGHTSVDGMSHDLHVRHEEFKELEFKRRELKFSMAPDAAERIYFVYKNLKEYVEVVAVSAKDAMEKSGIKKPRRIERADMVKFCVMKKSFFKDAEGDTPAQAPAAAAEVASPTATPPLAAEAAPEAPKA